MEEHLVYWLAIMTLVQIIACMINYVLWKYSKSKPLGQQTILDVAIQDFIKITMINFLTRTLIYVKVTRSYSHEVAIGIVTVSKMGSMASLLQIMATILVRYLYIFYPGFMNETSDSKIVSVTRCFVGLGALVSALLKDYANGPEYRYLTQTTSNASQEEVPTFWLFQVVLITNLLLLIFTQVRIEMFKKQTNPNERIINLNRRKPRNNHSVFGNKAIAITFILLLIFLVLILESLLFPGDLDNAAKSVRTRVIASIIINVLVPFLWMSKKRKIRDFFFRMISSDQKPSQKKPSQTVPRLKLVSMRTNRVSPMV